MFGKINCRIPHKICLILHLFFLTKHCIAILSDKPDLYPEKYEDFYDEDKLQNFVWMNMFGTYPTLNADNSKIKTPNLTHDFDKNNENFKLSSSDVEKSNLDDKSVGNIEKSKLFNKFDISLGTNTDKTLFEMVEYSPLYRLCLRTVNVVETCLALFLKTSNMRKILADKQRICANMPTWFEFRQCLQQTGDDRFNKFFEKNILMPVVKKNKKITDTPKRLPFHAWGGKRFNQVGTEKIQTSRVPFNAWGGKRQAEYEQPFNSYGESCEPCKRSKAKFHSWGGKRSKRKATI